MTNELSSLQKLQEIIEIEKGVVLYFYSDCCAPCLSLRPKVNELIDTEFAEMKLVFINSETYPKVPAHFGVFANPCLLVFFEGKEYYRYSKYVSIHQLGSDIHRIYSMVF